MKVGELFGLVGLDTDEFDDGLVKVERRMEAADVDRTAELGLDDSRFTGALDQDRRALDGVDGSTATAKITADNSDLKSKVDESESLLDGLKDVDVPGLGAAGAAGGAAFAGAFMASMDAEASADMVAAQLGLDESQGRELGRLAAGSFTQGFGENIGQVGEAQVAAMRNALVNPFLDSDAAVVDTTNQLLALSDLMGEEVPAVAEAAGQMIRTGLASNAQEAFDLLARGQILNVNHAQDLLDTYTEYPTMFRQLGLSGSESMGLLAQATAAGARDSDIAADAMKEFAIRAQDGSELTADSFAALGLSSWQMAQDIAAGGPRAAGALDKTLDALRRIEDPAKRSQIAVGLFGTQSEDMQKALYAMDPSNAVSALGQVGGAAQKASKQMSSNAQTDWSTTWANITTNASNAMTNLRSDFGGSLGGLVEEVENHFGDGMRVIGEEAGGAVDVVEEAFGEIPGWMGGLWEQVEDGAGKLPEALGAIFEGLEAVTVEPLKAEWNAAAGWFNALTFPTIGPWDVGAFGQTYTIGPFGGWDLPDLPTFHSGGDVRAPGGGEVVAKLLDGERVLNRNEADAYRRGDGGGRSTVKVYVAGSVTTERDLARTISKHMRTEARGRK